MDIKTFVQVAPNLPAEIAILMRGPTGIGKSHLAKAIADKLGMPFIDVRGSTMSEGDVGGYPDLEGMKESGVMTFCMPSWFIRSCREPVVLMLDELNRSLPGVQQSFFQLVLDRELGNDKDGMPYRLHPETRVIAAVNHGSEYDVNEMDPALLRRFWVSDLEPTVDDWIEWADDNTIDVTLVDFIRQNPAHLRVDPSQVEPGTVVPTPASWHRLDAALTHGGMAPSELAGKARSPGFYATALGFVGVEAAIAFTTFVEKYELILSAEDILDNYKDNKDKLKKTGTDQTNALIEKLANHSKNNDWTSKQAKNIEKFSKQISGEMIVHLWNKITSACNQSNIKMIHELIGMRICMAVKEAQAADKSE